MRKKLNFVAQYLVGYSCGSKVSSEPHQASARASCSAQFCVDNLKDWSVGSHDGDVDGVLAELIYEAHEY